MPPPTANDAGLDFRARNSVDLWIAQTAFVALLLLVFIGLTPFAPRTAAAIAARDATSASGDLARQLSFLSVFAVIAFAAVRIRGWGVLASVPIMLAALMAWCALSASWAGEPDVTFRRAILAAILVWSVMLSVDTLGSERTLALLRVVFAVLLVVDFLSVVFIHQAVHQSDEVEASLAGDWRGVHSHKNTAGFFMASASVLFFYFARKTRRPIDILLCAASLVFLVMTRSKSSMGLLPVAVLMALFYRFAWRSGLDRLIAMVGIGLVTLVCALAITLEWDAIARFLQDPEQLTGRAAIWQAELSFIRDHPMLGSGFNSFANTGVHSPIYHYVGPTWVASIGEGHGGYLELLVTIGFVGFALAMIALVVQPFLAFWRAGGEPGFNVLLFTLFSFIVLHNFMESDFLEGTAPQWAEFLVILALLRVSRREARASAAA
jgi:O-antigen ligase